MNKTTELWIPAAKGYLGCTMSRVSCVADKNVCVCVCVCVLQAGYSCILNFNNAVTLLHLSSHVSHAFTSGREGGTEIAIGDTVESSGDSWSHLCTFCTFVSAYFRA